MPEKQNNFAYIDGANLHRGILDLGWQLDYARFRVWLEDKYNIKRAYIFIGLIPKYAELYKYLQESGFVLVYKEVVYDGDGKPKGNCDADLVLQTVTDTYENNFDKTILVSSDGDYAGMVKFLQERKKLFAILSPHPAAKCSVLLKRTGAKIAYLDDQRNLLEMSQKEKAPGEDEPHKGLSRKY